MKKILVMFVVAAALLAFAGGVSYAEEICDYYASTNLMRKALDGYINADLYEYLDEDLYGGWGRFSLIYTYDEIDPTYKTYDWMDDYVAFTLYFGTYSVTPGLEPPDYLRMGVNPLDFRARYIYKNYGNYDVDTSTNGWVLLEKTELGEDPETGDSLLSTYDYEISPRKEETLVIADSAENAIGNFGSLGVYKYNSGTSWTKIATSNPDKMIAVGSDLIGDFGSLGVYKYNSGTSWTKIATSNPEDIIAVGTTLVGNFGSLGVYKYNSGTSWTKIATNSPEKMFAVGSDLIGDFGSRGLYKYNSGTSWTKIASNSTYVNNLTEYTNCSLNMDDGSEHYGQFTALGYDDDTLEFEGAAKYHTYFDGDGHIEQYNADWQLTQQNDLPEEGIASEGFMRGINLPWLHYGSDIGTADGFSTNYDDLYRALDDYQGGFVRVFIFSDMRNGFTFDENGVPTGFTDESKIYSDMEALLETCMALGIKVMPVLFDCASGADGGLANNHADLIIDPAKRQALIDLLTKEGAEDSFFARFANHPALFAWDIMNEPEGAIGVNDVTIGDLQAFVAAFSEVVHNYDYYNGVTVGSERRSYLELYWEGFGGFNEGYLDFYQFHYYDSMGLLGPDGIDSPVFGYTDAYGGFIPTIAGELEPTFFTDKLNILSLNGYVGGLFWQDANYNISDSERDELRFWYPLTDVVTTYTYYDSGRMKEKSVSNTDSSHGWLDYQKVLDEDYFYDAETDTWWGRDEVLRFNDARDPDENNGRAYKYEYCSNVEWSLEDPWYGATRMRCFNDSEMTTLTLITTRYDQVDLPSESVTYLDGDYLDPEENPILTSHVQYASGATQALVWANDSFGVGQPYHQVYWRGFETDGSKTSYESLAVADVEHDHDLLSYIYSYYPSGNGHLKYAYEDQLFQTWAFTAVFNDAPDWSDFDIYNDTSEDAPPLDDLCEWDQKAAIVAQLEDNESGDGLLFVPALAGEEDTAWTTHVPPGPV